MNQNLLLTPRTVIVLIVMLLFNWTASPAQKNYLAVKELPDPALQEKLAAMVKDFRGDVGICVRDFPTGGIAAIRADELFPTASRINVSRLLWKYLEPPSDWEPVPTIDK